MTRLLLLSSTSFLLEECLASSAKTGGPYTRTIDNLAGSCIDNRGQVIQEGRLFEPGPDECQVCTCLRQQAVHCRTVLCAPPQGCRSLRVGDACCEWVCDKWDDAVNGSVSDLGLRLMASAITAIFSLSLLFFLIYRLRQRKLRSRQNHMEAEGYRQEEVVEVEDITGQAHTFQLSNIKPQDRIMLRRPFPPSYNEAMYSAGGGAPPYSSIHQDPVISYPVATLGRLVLPTPGSQAATVGRRRQTEEEPPTIPSSNQGRRRQTEDEPPSYPDPCQDTPPGQSDEDLTQTTV